MTDESATTSAGDDNSWVEVHCHHCGYDWHYTGTRDKATCPECNGKTPVPAPTVDCHKCGYEWEYEGDLRLATCPSCNHKTPVHEETPA